MSIISWSYSCYTTISNKHSLYFNFLCNLCNRYVTIKSISIDILYNLVTWLHEKITDLTLTKKLKPFLICTRFSCNYVTGSKKSLKKSLCLSIHHGYISVTRRLFSYMTCVTSKE